MKKGKNIYKTLRQIRGIEVSELAEMLGMTAREIHNVESGQSQLEGQKLTRYAEALGVTPEFILHRNAEKKSKKETKFDDYV